MKMLKKIISLLLSLIMVISLGACNNKTNNESVKSTPGSALEIGDVITINEIGELTFKKIQMSERIYANMTNGSYIATDTKGISYIDLVFRFKNKGNDIAASDIGHIVNSVEDKTNKNIVANTTVHGGENATVHMSVTVPSESVDNEYNITLKLPENEYTLTYKAGDYKLEGKELTVGKTIDNSDVKAKINTMGYSLSMYEGAPEVSNATAGKVYISTVMEVTNKKGEPADVDEIISVSTVKGYNTYPAEYFIKTGEVFAPEGKLEKNDTAEVLAVIFLPISYSKEDTKVNIAIDHEDFYFQLKGTEELVNAVGDIEEAEDAKEAAQEIARLAAEELRRQDDEKKNLADAEVIPKDITDAVVKKDDSSDTDKSDSKKTESSKKSSSKSSESEKNDDSNSKKNSSKNVDEKDSNSKSSKSSSNSKNNSDDEKKSTSESTKKSDDDNKSTSDDTKKSDIKKSNSETSKKSDTKSGSEEDEKNSKQSTSSKKNNTDKSDDSSKGAKILDENDSGETQRDPNGGRSSKRNNSKSNNE